MDDGATASSGIIVLVLLIIIDFVLFGFLAALRSLGETGIEKMAKDGDKRAKLLLEYLEKPARYTQVCQLLLLIAHMISGYFLVPFARRMLSGYMGSALAETLCFIAFIAVLILIVSTLGVYAPQKVASRKPEAWALHLVGLIHTVEVILTPVLFVCDRIANPIARALGVDPYEDIDDVTEEEIISMVNEGHEQGVLLASEAEMINNIFEFGDKEAKDIMIHRKNMMTLDGNISFYDALLTMKGSTFSRFPVYIDDIDNIIGVLHIKDALDLSLDTSLFGKKLTEIDGLIREVQFIPETRNINNLFAMMQRSKNHMVIVVDEYGQTSGVVAMEDIIEEIVGNIEDEHDEEQTMIESVSDGEYMIDGMANFDEVAELLGINSDEIGDFDTLNGFLISLIDKIPSEDEQISEKAYGYLFEILSVENKMIKKVHVVKLPDEPSEEGNEDEPADEDRTYDNKELEEADS